MNPLNSVRGSIITGVIIALVITLAIQPTAFHELGLARWLHVLSGVMWIGLLYYFNVAQTPGARRRRRPTRADRAAPASPSTWHPAPCCGSAGARCRPGSRAPGTSVAARISPMPSPSAILARTIYGLVIGIGAWLGTIMLFNVWVLIWPNQKKILGIVPATDEEKARARRVARHGLAHQFRAVDTHAAVHGVALHTDCRCRH